MKSALHTVVLFLAGLAIIVMSSATGCDSGHTSKDTATAQASATAGGERFTLRDIDGKWRNWSEFAGKPVVINFWATWCGPCRHEIPTLKQLYEEYKDKGVQIVGVSIDGPKTVDNVVGFSKQFEIPWVVVYADQKVVEEFKLGNSIPMTVFIDANGKETGRVTGAQSYNVFKTQFDKLVGDFPPKS